jgi:toxin-antitoxin system PIN domain toxin
MMFLPDVNLWLALAFSRHVHHVAAKNWFETVPDQNGSFCRLTQQGFLRLATNPKALDDEAVSLQDAWRLYDAFLGDPRVVFANEPAGLEPLWRVYTQGKSFSPKVWNDAYLAAFAQAAVCEVVTFDKGFKAYQDVSCSILG